MEGKSRGDSCGCTCPAWSVKRCTTRCSERVWRAWREFWKGRGWRCAESATSIWRIARRCVRDTWRARWCWADGGSQVQRPRARSVAGCELRLPSWREWSARDPLEQRAVEQMVLGVSTRGYARSLEPLPKAVAVRGVSKSAVSERFVYGTERKLAELMSRELRQLRVVALLIDGVHFGEHVVLTAVGVDEHGDKHVLGLREGATENAAAVRALLADLTERGLDTSRSLLIVIDGAKALHKAVVEVF